MRNRIFVAAGIFCLACTMPLTAQSLATAARNDRNADPAHIHKLIEDLGSVSFADREQASKELEQIGQPALSELRKAVKSDDTETSCRATRLVSRLEEKARTAALLAPMKVRLSVKDVTVMEAINELDRKIRPNKIEVIGDRNPLNTRKITLDTGEVTYWEALHQLCQKGRLVEQQVNNTPAQPFPPGRRGFVQPGQQVQNRNIVLMDGAPQDTPISFAGSVRVRSVNPSGPLNPGETQVMLDVSAEQRLQSFGLTGALIFDRAIDDQGQSLSFVPQQSPTVPNNFNGNGFMMVNGMLVPYGGNTFVPRTMGFRFHKGAKNARMMKELSGQLIVQALSDTEPLVTVDDFRKTVGKLVKGKESNSLQVRKVEAIDNGAIRVEVSVEATPAHNGGPNNFNGGNMGFMVLNGNFNGMINGVQFVNGVPMNGIPTVFPKLVDIKGKAWDPEVNSQRPEVANGRVVRHATLTYRPQAEARQLVLFGQRTILFAVPFALKNVPLQQ